MRYFGRLTAIWFGLFSVAVTANAGGGGDFPFFTCKSFSLGMVSFSVGPDANSVTGYTMTYTDALGLSGDMPVEGSRLDPYWTAEGTVIEPLGKRRWFRAQIPVQCDGHCVSHAEMDVSRIGIALPLGPIVLPARCQISG